MNQNFEGQEERFDLFGKLVREHSHITTELNRNKIKLLSAPNWAKTRITRVIRTTGATFGRHYFRTPAPLQRRGDGQGRGVIIPEASRLPARLGVVFSHPRN